jgi:2-deoxystreptamine N-acetyl-D-glucosaminyltransferase/2-deoxystreptamine glucosyltransferase
MGAWVASKGVGTLAAALTTVADGGTPLEVTLAGTGVEGATVLDAMPAPLRQMVAVVPSIANEQVPALLDEHDIFVLPSRFEGASVALSEAMARGLAVVATRVGAAPDHITHGVDGLLVPPDDVQAMAAAISSLSADPSLRARLSAAASRSAQRHRSDAVAARTIEVYEAALRAQMPRRRMISRPIPRATASAPAAAPMSGHGDDVDGAAGPPGA